MNDYRLRALADSRDRVEWTKKRIGRLGASDVARFAKVESAHLYLKAKLSDGFAGNAYTAHGNEREAAILARYGLTQNFTMYHAEGNDRFVATPDAIEPRPSGGIMLSQAKTTAKPILYPSPAYQRQMWWEQFVMDSEKTLFVWEEHDNFRPRDPEPQSLWFYRDEDQINKLVTIANIVLEGMDAADEFRRSMSE